MSDVITEPTVHQSPELYYEPSLAVRPDGRHDEVLVYRPAGPFTVDGVPYDYDATVDDERALHVQAMLKIKWDTVRLGMDASRQRCDLPPFTDTEIDDFLQIGPRWRSGWGEGEEPA